MIGSILGDMMGSLYEFDRGNKEKSGKLEKVRDREKLPLLIQIH